MEEEDFRKIVREEIHRALGQFLEEMRWRRYYPEELGFDRAVLRLVETSEVLSDNVMRLQAMAPSLRPTRCGFDRNQADKIEKVVDDISSKLP